MTGALSTIVLEPPNNAHGIATSRGVYRLVVQAAIANQSQARWDTSTWQNSPSGGGNWVWSDGYQWEDVSSRIRSAQWHRGREGAGDRPEVGTASVTLGNPDGYLSPWNNATTFVAPTYLNDGTTVRIAWAASSPTWQPAFTGVIDEVHEVATTLDADLSVTWNLVDTTALLSAIDHDAQEPQGAGDLVHDRLNRLLDDADWPYGTGVNVGGYYSPFDSATLQATTMADNRLTEVYLTADSGFVDAFSDRYGRLDAWAKGYSEPWYLADGSTQVKLSESAVATAASVATMPWVNAPEVITSSVGIVNDVTAARVNGGSASGIDPASVNKHRRATYRRTDLLLDADDDLDDWVGFALLIWANIGTKLGAIELDINMDSRMFEAFTRLDFGRSLPVLRTVARQGSSYTDTTFTCQIYGYTVSTWVRSPGVVDATCTLNVVVTAKSP